jgi:hypothetical protein
MKHTLLFYILLLFSTALWAQSDEAPPIAISATIVDSVFTVDITDSDLDLGIHTVITNNTDEAVQLKWTRKIKSMPDSWETYICIDNVICYFPEADTNYDPDNEVEDPLELKAGESRDVALHVLPQNVMGDGSFEVTIALTSRPDSVIGQVDFNATIRDRTSNASYLTARDIRIFPNPATDYLMLTEYSQIGRIDIYSLLGRRMRSFNILDDRSLNISDLPNGLYLVGIVDLSGRTVKTLRLSKQAYRP